MSCFNKIGNSGLEKCQGSINERSTISISFQSGMAKVFKLLSRQYQIISLSVGQPVFTDEKVIEQPLLIRYTNLNLDGTIFEWTMDPHEFKIN